MLASRESGEPTRAAGTGTGGNAVVARFGGTGDRKTAKFRVRAGWQIQWVSGGKKFVLAVKGDRDLGRVIDQKEAGSGVESPAGAGTFYLEVSADGPWSVRIVQRK